MAPRVIVSGLVRDGLGLGEAARGYALALATAGYPVHQHAVTLPGRPDGVGAPGRGGVLAYPEADDESVGDLVVVCLNPPELAALRERHRPLPLGRRNVGMWAWEVDPVPPTWATEAGRFEEIWAPSRYAAALIRQAVDVPVVAVPPPIRMPVVESATASPPDGRPRFLVLADVASTLARKNPLGAVQAFRRAFRPDEGPTLLVKIWNGHLDPAGVSGLRSAAAGRSDIEIADRWIDRAGFTDLLTGSSCLVSLHRAEGLGLTIFEALSVGVPVVITAFSGPIEWLDEQSAYLVGATPATVTDDIAAYPAGASWAEPDLDEAAAQIRRVWDDLDGARIRAGRGRRIVTDAMSPEAVGRRLRDRVEPLIATAGDAIPRSAIRPSIQVVIAAAEPWPDLAPFLAVTGPQLRSVGAELLVGVADGRVLPECHRPPGVRTIAAGSRDPFVLRAVALEASDADLLVVTEDHCRPSPGWLEAYRRAYHLHHPRLMAGPIGNGSTASAADWANYLIGFAAYAPPLIDVPDDRCPTIANCGVPGAVMRDAVDGGPLPPGWFERQLIAELWRVGATELVPDAHLDHVQPFPWWHHLRNQFGDARCAGAHAAIVDPGFRPGLAPGALTVTARTFLRGVVAAVAPRPALHEPHRRTRRWLRTMAGARAIGLAVGARFGQGRSGERLD